MSPDRYMSVNEYCVQDDELQKMTQIAQMDKICMKNHTLRCIRRIRRYRGGLGTATYNPRPSSAWHFALAPRVLWLIVIEID